MHFKNFCAVRMDEGQLSAPMTPPDHPIRNQAPCWHFCRHVDAQSLPGALTGGLNYYRALSKGLWTRPRKEIRQPVKVIWGEDDTAMGKELAEPPKNRVPNQEVVFIPKVSAVLFFCSSVNHFRSFHLSR